MLVLARKIDEQIFIELETGELITLTMVRLGHGYVRIGIGAPKSARIFRDDTRKERVHVRQNPT